MVKLLAYKAENTNEVTLTHNNNNTENSSFGLSEDSNHEAFNDSFFAHPSHKSVSAL